MSRQKENDTSDGFRSYPTSPHVEESSKGTEGRSVKSLPRKGRPSWQGLPFGGADALLPEFGVVPCYANGPVRVQP